MVLFRLLFLALAALTMGTGCAGATINPGHRGILFDPGNNGIRPEVLKPGWVGLDCPFWVPGQKCPRVDDFDVTYHTSEEQFHVLSKEGLPMEVQIAVSYRPIVSELYMLDTEIGSNYFDKVIGPEFRNASIGVFSQEAYQDLQRQNSEIESKIEKRLRERLQGKHLEVSSVFIQKVSYDPKILQEQQQEVVSRQETETKKQLLENQAEQKKQQAQARDGDQGASRSPRRASFSPPRPRAEEGWSLAAQTEQKKLEMSTELEIAKLEATKNAEAEKARIDSELRNKDAEKKVTTAQAQIDKMKADAHADAEVAQAKGESESRLMLAKASAAENSASAANVTPMQVEMHAYDALGKLGGTGTTMLLGDPSKLPSWLFPHVPGFQTAFAPMYTLPPLSPSDVTTATTHASLAPSAGGNPY